MRDIIILSEKITKIQEQKSMQIYADNAATTKMSRSAIDAMLSVMEENYGNPSSLHSIGQRAAEELFRARERIALRAKYFSPPGAARRTTRQ